MADMSAIYDAIRTANAQGDMDSVKKLSAYLQTQAPQNNIIKASPTDGMSTGDKFLAGTGKAFVDLGRGAGQMMGLTSRGDVAESRKLDAPLMATTPGKIGDLTGNIAAMVPTAFIPGANTLAGAGAIGAATGLFQPSTSTGETAANIGLGTALAPAGLLAGRGIGALYQGVKSALEPLFAGGQQRIAARTLQSFAGTPQEGASAASSLMNSPSVLPGVQPTTAELANNAGISQLTRVLKNNPEYATTLANRDASNRAVMSNAVSGIAGTDTDLAAAHAARTQAVSGLYDTAAKASAPIDSEMTALLQRPSMQTAIGRAQSLAAENGHSFGLAPNLPYLPTELTGRDLQYLKMSLNDMANSGPQAGMGAHEVGAIKGTLNNLNGWINAKVPALKAADAAYGNLSKPINQMQIGGQLADKLNPALADFGGNSQLNAAKFATAMRNGDQLAANATGWKGSTLANTLSPEQQTTLQQVGEQLARRSNANATGVVGSNTGQNLVGQNLLRQFLGPLGLPSSMGERVAQSTLGQQITRPLKFIAGFGEDNIRNNLAQAMLDPKIAAGLLQLKQNPALARALWARQGLLGAPAQGLGQALVNPSQQ